MGNEPVNSKTFGGVEFNWNQVKSAQVRTNKSGEKIYFIEFKTGVKAEYPLQEGGTMKSRELTMWQSLDYDTETILTGIKGAKIKGSENDDHIIARGVQDSEIDVSGDNNDDHVDVESKHRVDKYERNGYQSTSDLNSSNNRIILGEGDTATATRKNNLRIHDENGKLKSKKEHVYTRDIEGPGIDNKM